MNYSTAGFPVLHHLPELAQTLVHWLESVLCWMRGYVLLSAYFRVHESNLKLSEDKLKLEKELCNL